MKRAVILISAHAEWRAVLKLFQDAVIASSHHGDSFLTIMGGWQCRFFHGGWGKISSAASTQYAVDRWSPDLLINLGTCGGFGGEVERGSLILVEKTIVYDIYEQMGDYDEHIAHYTTQIDLSWLKKPYPLPVKRDILVSGDQDLVSSEIPRLKSLYHASAGDWESGAIAWTAARNKTRLLILRGVTDLVDQNGSPAYGDLAFFESAAYEILEKLVRSLPAWLSCVEN